MENKVQDLKLKVKIRTITHRMAFYWNFYKNKINNLIDLKSYINSILDSLDLAIELNKKIRSKNKKLSALLPNKPQDEETKSGVWLDAIEIYKQILKTCPNIILKGVMSIGACRRWKNYQRVI